MQLDEKVPEQIEASRKVSLKFLGLSLILLTLLIVGAVYLWHRHKSDLIPAPIYSYSRMVPVSVEGKGQGSGMAFTKPAELTQISSAPGQIELEHLQTLSNGKKKMISYVAADSSVTNKSVPQAQLDNLSRQVTDAKSFNQSSYSLNSLNSFLQDRLPEGWSIELDSGTSFKNAYIKKNAWSFDLIAKDPKSTQELDGKVLYAVSRGNHYYYLVIISQPADWKLNYKTWNAVFSSIEIDQ